MNISLSLALPDRRGTMLGLGAVLHAKGRVLEAMSDSAARLRQGVSRNDRILFDQLATVAQQLSDLTHQSPGKLSPEVYRTRRGELAAEQEGLQTELSKRSAEFRQQTTPISSVGVQAALPPESVLVEWFRFHPADSKAKDSKTIWGKPRYVAYVLRHEGEPAVVDVGDAEAIERLIKDFRIGLSDPKTTYVKEVARELSDRLVKPLLPYLGNAEQWLISPDGALNLLPFAALVDETGTYLARRVDIAYLTSGRDLLRFWNYLCLRRQCRGGR